jgi:Zinc finger, C2H2 type.
LFHNLIKISDLGAVSEILFVFSFSDSSFDGDTKRWSGWSVTCGDVLASLGTSELVVVKKESKTPSKESSAPKKTTTRARGVFPCERCGRSYVRKDSLQRHLKYECGKEPTFQCPFCPQRCKRKAHQIRHIRRQHSDMINVIEPKGDSRIMDTSNE